MRGALGAEARGSAVEVRHSSGDGTSARTSAGTVSTTIVASVCGVRPFLDVTLLVSVLTLILHVLTRDCGRRPVVHVAAQNRMGFACLEPKNHNG